MGESFGQLLCEVHRILANDVCDPDPGPVAARVTILRAESAGVWWASMSFKERSQYASFLNNQAQIESRWDKRFGDRQNELVIIGQDLNEEIICQELEKCLCTEEEIKHMESNGKFNDPFPKI
jgi:hypothetical protein